MRKLAHIVKIAEPNAKELDRLLAARTYDLIYCFGLHQVSPGSLMPATRREIPILWHVGDHFLANHFQLRKASRLYTLMLDRVLRKWHQMERSVDYSHMAFVSQFLLDYFKQMDFPLKNTYVVPRGIDFPIGKDFDRTRQTPASFLIACRFDSTKGVHIGIEAARLLRLRRPDLDWQIRIAGTGDPTYVFELKRAIAEGQLEGHVQFIGKLSRPETLLAMREATAFLSTSIWGEPFANTIIETLASGTPLIGADSGSILEVVRDGESALIYKKADAELLSRHMESILTDPPLSRRLTENGIKVIEERYTMDRILDITEDLFQKVVSERG